jgi:hypothetical protein
MNTTQDRDGIICHFSGDGSGGVKIKVFSGKTKVEMATIPATKRLMIYGYKVVCDAANVLQVFDDTGAANDTAVTATAPLGSCLLDGSYAANGGEAHMLPVPFGVTPGRRLSLKTSGSGTVRFIGSGRLVDV